MFSGKTPHGQIMFFFVIISLAVFFRVYHLESVPPGLYPDEAMNGNDAMETLKTGDFKVFYPNNNGREGLYNNLTAVVFKFFGPHIWSLKLTAVIGGILGVLALYLLSKEWFNWPIAALSAFLMAVSFWHVNFSRLAFRAILAPTLFTFALYFFWKGLRGKYLFNFFFSGLLIGLGFYTYLAFRVTPLIVLLIFWAYWLFITKDFDGQKYWQAKERLIRGLVLVLVTAILVGLPLGVYYWLHPSDFFGRTAQISIFAQPNPLKSLGISTLQTLGMFNFAGDHNWRHNWSGQPTLWWPIGVFFVAGFLRGLIKIFRHRREHGHLAIIPLAMLLWFLVGLLPVVFSSEGLPHALRSILVAPVVFLWAGEGAWWFFNVLKQWYKAYDKHPHEAELVSTLVLILFLAGLAFSQFDVYFNQWGRRPETASAFTQEYVKIGKEINSLPVNVKKYVVVEAGDVFVNSIPVPAQTVMFITQTFSLADQQKKNVFYLTVDQFAKQKTAIIGGPHTVVYHLRQQ